MMKMMTVLASAVIVLLAAHSPASAQKRLALLIGNQSYAEAVGPLKNPHNDIERIGASLRKLGFDVAQHKDADFAVLSRAVRRFAGQVHAAGDEAISFVYYSGHGVADPETQRNFIVPVDVKSADTTELSENSIDLQKDIIQELRTRAPKATHYVVFDACRNELQLKTKGKKSLGATKGLLPVAQTAGILVAYATAPGQTASDEGDGVGPYARALAEEIVKPGIEAVTMFRHVQLRVQNAIGQDPWLSFPTLPPIYLAGVPKTVAPLVGRLQDNTTVEEITALVLGSLGLPASLIRTDPTAEHDNIYTYTRDGQRYIGYSKPFVDKVRAEHGGVVSIAFIAAHEIGHQLAGHTGAATKFRLSDMIAENHRMELEADYFAGFVLQKMGADLDQVLAPLRGLVERQAAMASHPSGARRLRIVEAGWVAANEGMPGDPAAAMLKHPEADTAK